MDDDTNGGNSTDSHFILIDADEILDEIEYWLNAVVCFVLGANPPQEVLEGYFKRIRGKLGIDKIVLVGKGMFLVRFLDASGCSAVINGGAHLFGKKPLIVEQWHPDLDMSKQEVRSVPVWIRLPSLELKYWGEQTLLELATILGKPIFLDNITKNKEKLNFAHVLIEIAIDGDMPEKIQFIDEKGMMAIQRVEYECFFSMSVRVLAKSHLLLEEVDGRRNGFQRRFRRGR
ncbi:hypothetical protein RDABS01_036634 [Bienertia sinuspersici]